MISGSVRGVAKSITIVAREAHSTVGSTPADLMMSRAALPMPLTLALRSLHSGPVAAQALGAATQPVLAAEDQRFDAMVRGDTAALRSLLADGLTYTHSDGAQQSKAEFLQTIGSGALRYQSIKPEGRVVRLRGDVGVVTGRSAMRVTVGGEVHGFTIQYLAVYQHRSGQWQLLAWQSTRLP